MRWIVSIVWMSSFALLSVAAQVQVEQIPIAPLYPDGSKLCDAIVVGNEIILVGGEGMILRSRDGFATWQRQRIAPGEYRTIYSIEALGPGLWIVVGERGLCYRTLDAGGHWEPVPLPVDVTLYRVRKMKMSDNVVVAVGENGVILVSRYQGLNWKQKPSGTNRALWSVGWWQNMAVAVGEDGVVVRSWDAGYNWQVVRSPDSLQGTLYDVAAVDQDRWIAVGEGMVLVQSTDGGQQWDGGRILVPPKSDAELLRGIWFESDSVGWIVGETSSALWQPVWQTTDGGRTWKQKRLRIDTVRVKPGGVWWEYPIIWRGIRDVGGRKVLYGERSQCAIVAVEPPEGGTEWYRRVWDRYIPLSFVPGAKLESCEELLLLVGYPPAPQVLRYQQSKGWDTVAVLPFIDVWRDTAFAEQYGYHGERATGWVWNGNAVFVRTWYQHGWRSEDGGKTWEVVRFDSLFIHNVFPYGSRGFLLIGHTLAPWTEPYQGICLVSEDAGRSWQTLLRLGKKMRIRTIHFFDAQQGWALIDSLGDLQVWRTTDRGQHWQKHSIMPYLRHYSGKAIELSRTLSAKVYDPQHMDLLLEVAVLGDSGFMESLDLGLFASSDGGQTWQQQWWLSQYWEGTVSGNIIASFVAKNRFDKIVGVDVEQGGALLYTRDGTTWEKLVLPGSGILGGVIAYNGACAVAWRKGDLFSNFRVAPHHLLFIHFPVTSVEELEVPVVDSNIEVYPQPARETVFLRYGNAAASVAAVQLYSADGRLVARWNTAVKQIDLRNLVTGTYYIVLQMQTGEQHLVVFRVVR